MKRTLVIGDIHGDLEALNQALANAEFNIEEDRIICIGDYVDGKESSFEVVRTLLEIKNNSKFENIFLLGNHDQWFLEILKKDLHNFRDEEFIKNKYNSWYYQGGKATYESYVAYPDEFIAIHKQDFFENLQYYHIENENLFVHAGFHLELGFVETLRTKKKELIWDRSLYRTALEFWNVNKNLKKRGLREKHMNFGGFNQIFIGHSQTINDGILVPTKMGNIINVDQGCKKHGVLSIWVLETEAYYQNIRRI